MHLWSHRLIYLILLLVLLAGVPLLQQLMTHDQVASDGVAHRNIALSVPFDTEQIKTDVIVMMFGYVGCADVCTPLLMHLSHWYNSEAMRENRDAVRVVFVNLTPEAEPLKVTQFVKSFEEDFIGVYLPFEALKKVDRGFGLYYGRSPADPLEVNHTDSVYVLKRGRDKMWFLKSLFLPHPLNTARLTEEIEQLKKEVD